MSETVDELIECKYKAVRKTDYDCSECDLIIKNKCSIGSQNCDEILRGLGISEKDYGKYYLRRV